MADDAGYAWVPTPEVVERANVTRLMRTLGAADLDALRRASVADLSAFWAAVVEDLRIPFRAPWRRVMDDSRGPEWTTWFVGGRVNLTSACVDRWRTDPERADAPALIGEDEEGAVRVLSWRELGAEVDRLAGALRAAGVRRGDAVGVFMPMVPEAAIAAYAVAKVGAMYVPVFSGFAAAAIASRLRDSGARLVLAADGGRRRGRPAPMLPALDEALATCPAVDRCVVLERLGTGGLRPGRDVAWGEFTAGRPEECEAEDTESEDPFMIAYTSGTTGRPKGAVHVHGGFLVKIAAEVAYQIDLGAGEVLYWVTDMGWIMGPWSLVGAGALGATMLMVEGAPDHPDPGRVWATVARHRAAVVGVSPTLIRALRSRGEEWVRRHDRSSLRVIGSTGEPWNPEPYRWLSEVVGEGRRPIINISGGTEVGACFLSPHPVERIKPCSVGGPALGMDVAVFDGGGNAVRDQVGELVCRRPWPGMTRGVWGDRERYLASYWSTYPGVWRHGDWARVDADGQWFLFGRSDEAINLAGKRLGPAEVESILVGHPAVAEAAAVGVPDEVTGEALWCFWVPVDPAGDDVSAELRRRVADQLGRPFTPARVARVGALPRTRSAKILRRAVRAAALGEDPGDLSTAENPEALDGIREALEPGSAARRSTLRP
jgi:acetyl-CoA synthetase